MSIVLVFVILLAAGAARKAAQSPILSCYYRNGEPPVDQIPAGLCTHYLLIGNAGLTELGSFIPPDDDVSKEFGKLRHRHRAQWETEPTILLITITAPNPNWSELVSFEDNMRVFATDVRDYLLKYRFQGIDLDWEFPKWSRDAIWYDRDGLDQLLRILHETLSPAKLLVSLATSGPPTITRIAYNVSALEEYADLVQVMNYDFHVFSWTDPVVGFNAPLHRLSGEKSIAAQMNSESSMQEYARRGLSSAKSLFGMPVYNLAYSLVNWRLNRPYSPASGEVNGYGSHWQTCNLSSHSDWTYRWNEKAASPYLLGPEKVWVSAEDERSVREKASFAVEKGFRGIMVFAIGSDDYDGKCGNGRFPLISVIHQVLFNRTPQF